MELKNLGTDAPKIWQEILGYLNFSSGAPDSLFLEGINELFARIEAHGGGTEPTWLVLAAVLRAALTELRGSADVFRQCEQAEAVLSLVFEDTLPAYQKHHRDLLFHQTWLIIMMI